MFQDEIEAKKLHIDYTEEFKKQSRGRWAALDHLTGLPWVSKTSKITFVRNAKATPYCDLPKVYSLLDCLGSRIQCTCNALLGKYRIRMDSPPPSVRKIVTLSVPPQEVQYPDGRHQVYILTLHRTRSKQLSRQPLQLHLRTSSRPWPECH